MEKYREKIQCRCPECTAVKIDGVWVRWVFITMLAMFFPGGLSKELCGDCNADKERFHC